MTKPHVILGAGVAGLTTALQLHRRGEPVFVSEREEVIGGASRTVRFGEFRFDLGGHRFYTRNEEVKALVADLLGDELIEVGRLSRIYLNGRFIDYPLTFSSAFRGLGPFRTAAVTLSYVMGRLHGAVKDIRTFEDWVVARFGRGLYEFYFAPYSEKVWGVDCTKLSADFAAQRIKGLSFREALKNMFLRNVLRKGPPPSLITHFLYPRLGFGRIPERMAEELPDGAVATNSPTLRIEHNGRRINAVVIGKPDGTEMRLDPQTVVSTIPITSLILMLDPPAPDVVRSHAEALEYRDMVILFLVVDKPQVSPDHWIYFSSRDISFGRVHEPKNWSRDMAPPDRTGLVIEFFCFRDDDIWNADSDSLRAMAVRDLVRTGLIRASEAAEAMRIFLPHAYPIYVDGYTEHLKAVKEYLSRFQNLYSIGRNGMFRYTSADYYIEMGMKTAENILGADHDLEAIGAAQEYAEK